MSRFLFSRSVLRLVLVGTLLVAGGERVLAAARDYAVEVSAVAQESPPQIDFSWPADPSAEQHHVFKKAANDSTWGDPIAILPGSASGFIDTDVAGGEAWEYSFRRTAAVIADTVEVPSGDNYFFTIHDTWSDGMCCHHGLGSYQVRSEYGIHAEGGEFGASEMTLFSIPTSGEPTIRLIVSLIVDAFPDETTWTVRHNPSGDTLGVGGPYEFPDYGHIFAGIRYPAIEDRGTVLLLVTPHVVNHLSAEVNRLEVDLIADGYRVRREVAAATTVTDIKRLILDSCQVDPTIETLFILGNVPVPYSGDVRGAHSNHQGAWPADLYYGELDGVWTDETVRNQSASRLANHNVPGDGKFDQTFLPSDVDLMVGRVDLSRMWAFEFDENNLIADYLSKNHAYRRGDFTPERRGLIDDNVGNAHGLAFAAVGWRNFTAMFGPGAVHELDYFGTLVSDSYLWSYGCGGGSYTSCAGVGTTGDFATQHVQTVFSPLYGSYFGDWDNEDNILRAPLASYGQPLVSFWSGRPTWHLHHMALGHSIGYSARLSQNNNHEYTVSDGTRQIHPALMGDPPLKMHVVEPVGGLSLALHGEGGVRLDWSAPGETVDGYHAYRAPDLHGTFERINAEVIGDTSFVDTTPRPGNNTYMVRAMRVETTGSGTYCNLSGGVIDSVLAETGVLAGPPSATGYHLSCYPNPFNPETTLRYHLPAEGEVRLDIYSVAGRRIRTLVDGRQPAGWHDVAWDGRDSASGTVAAGVYLCRLEIAGDVRTRKVTLTR